MSRRKVRRQLLAGFQLAQRGSRGAGPTASAQCARGTQGGIAGGAARLAQVGRAAVGLGAAQRVQRAVGHMHGQLPAHARGAEEVRAGRRPHAARARHLLQAHAAGPGALRVQQG